MTAPAPEKCDVCGAAPVELVLYPVAIHYKGSGFYSTDYGKGKTAKNGRRRGRRLRRPDVRSRRVEAGGEEGRRVERLVVGSST